VARAVPPAGSLLAAGLANRHVCHATEYVGKVVGITNGDTLTWLTSDNQQVKVRLAEIDTPESRQPYGTRAKQALSDLAYGKEARVVVQDTDKYGRTVGWVYVGSTDVNAELVRQGAAWVYRQYVKDASLYRREDEAKAAKRGSWSLPEAERMPPWEWRHGGAGGTATRTTPAAATVPAVPTAANAAGFTCGGKRYCREMTSCEEARFYLKQCGVRSLDGDGDGTPCETLCR
jgi:endonuclease YncB( thermonuclease family)